MLSCLVILWETQAWGDLGKGLGRSETIVCEEERITKGVGKITRDVPQLWEELGLGFHVISPSSCFDSIHPGWGAQPV